MKCEIVDYDSSHRSASYTYSAPVDEASGPKYRKIGLTGLPLPDEKPQSDEETDEEPEETYIDALSGDLRHSVTDVYVPIPASDLALTVRRNTTSTIWNQYSGLRPHEEPAQPFGAGWSSNLGAHAVIREEYANVKWTESDSTREKRFLAGLPLRVRRLNGVSQLEPNTATVIDENGSAYSFAIWYPETDTHGTSPKFYPMPSGRHDQETNLATLKKVGNTLVLRRKHGNTCIYDIVSDKHDVSSDRKFGSYQFTRHTYARLTSVSDRNGTTIQYGYGGTGLIPASMTCRGETILIQQSGGRVQAVIDPRGYKIDYGYGFATGITAGTGDGPVAADFECLTGVEFQDGATVSYSYEAHKEDELRPYALWKRDPDDDDRLETPTYHINLGSITDANDRTYSFNYQEDHARETYYSQPTYTWQSSEGEQGYWKPTGQFRGHVTQSGLPRNVSGITGPENLSTSISYNHSIKLTANGGLGSVSRVTNVIDCAGTRRSYVWGGHEVEVLQAFKDSYREIQTGESGTSSTSETNIVAPRIIYSTGLTISTRDANDVLLGYESYSFSPNAGFAVTSATDMSGNQTTFSYGNGYTVQDYPSSGSSASVGFGNHYNDPTAQTNALGKTRCFTYGPGRIMTSIEDEIGRFTYFELDAHGNRTSERVYAAKPGSLALPLPPAFQTTEFAYEDPNFPGFMTRKSVLAEGTEAGSDPSWVTSLTTLYEPDSFGRVEREAVDMNGNGDIDAGDFITAYTYDANGNKLSVTDPRGYTTHFTYDERNRLVDVIHPDGLRPGRQARPDHQRKRRRHAL
jgi:YD repeat-containing protein